MVRRLELGWPWLQLGQLQLVLTPQSLLYHQQLLAWPAPPGQRETLQTLQTLQVATWRAQEIPWPFLPPTRLHRHALACSEVAVDSSYRACRHHWSSCARASRGS